MRTDAKYLAQVGMVGALYASLTFAFSPISYGPVQVRISEALTVLPYVMPASVWGLFIGCFLANWLGGLGPWDIFAGSLCTLLAAVLNPLGPQNGKALAGSPAASLGKCLWSECLPATAFPAASDTRI